MKKKCVILIQILTMIILLPSCEIDNDIPVCDYDVQLEYWLSDDGQKNTLYQYVRHIEQYIFDEKGVLFYMDRLEGSSSGKGFVSELELPAGRYSVVSWGNRAGVSKLPAVTVGHTRLSELLLRLNDPVGDVRTHNQSEQLYYGYHTFTVDEYGASRVRVYMSHAHLLLEVIVKWKRDHPVDTKDFRMTLRDMQDTYTFMPQYKVSGNSVDDFSEVYEEYPIRSFDKRFYLKSPVMKDTYIMHAQDVDMDIVGNVNGRFLAYRITNDSHPLLRLYAGDKPLMKEIDLYRYFQTMSIELDRNLQQEFSIIVEIDGDQVTVRPVVISDWENGGEIGGGLI